MEYIIVKDGIIVDHCCGSVKPENAIEVPSGFQGYVGSKFVALKDDLSGLKPLSQQVSEGIFTIPDGYKINDDDTEIIRMNQEEIDNKFLPLIYAIPDTYEEIKVHKTFDREGNFDYYPPEKCVKMNTEQPAKYYKASSDGTWVFDITEAKKEKLTEINSAYDNATSSLVSSYPQTEVLTFDQQEQEARMWKENNESQTLLVDMLAAGRQIDKSLLVDKIILKSDTFKVAIGYLTGQRQRYEDILEEATTEEEITSIKPIYTLPE